jgi:hypothetical protein
MGQSVSMPPIGQTIVVRRYQTGAVKDAARGLLLHGDGAPERIRTPKSQIRSQGFGYEKARKKPPLPGTGQATVLARDYVPVAVERQGQSGVPGPMLRGF